MKKKKSQELKKAAAETYSAAAEQSTYALQEAVAKAQHVLKGAVDRSGPVLKDAKERSAAFAARRLDHLEPRIKGALDRVTPAVETAREKLSDDVLPRLQGVLHEAAGHPVVAEATRRGGATIQALKGELEPKRKKSKVKAVFKFLAIGAAVAGAVAAVRHFLAPKDDGWTAHEPSKAYVNSNDTFATAARFAAETVEEEAPPAEESAVEDVLVNDSSPEAPTAAPESTYGEGSYVGANPPEGFTIKGNERSKKYHVEGTGGYERTIAEVWFNSEEAAQAAGFTKAQR